MRRLTRSAAGRTRAAWMAAYERAAVARDPSLAGRLCWDTAAHLYNTGKAAPEAAQHAAALPKGTTNGRS